VFFSDTGTQIQSESSRDGKALIAALEKNKTNLRTLRRSAGFYGAVERFELSLQTLRSLVADQSTRPGRKLLIWISPGWPILTGPHVELSAKEERSLFQSVVQMSQALRQARITLYSVDPLGTADAAGFRTFYYQQFLKGPASATKAQAGNLALQVLAYQSGGSVLNSSNDVASEIAKCVKDTTAYYRMSIHGAPAEGRDEYHQLQVLIDKPGLTGRTRTGYYAQP
jgi:VWFA-related protein